MTWNIGGDLGTGYVPPLSPGIGGDVKPAAQTATLSGINSLDVGLGQLVFDQTVFANSTNVLEFGLSDVSIRTRFVTTSGISPLVVGSHAVADFFQYAYPFGISPLSFGTGRVSNFRQEAILIGSDYSTFGTAIVEREREAFLSGFESLTVGVPRVSDNKLFVRPLDPSKFDEHGNGSVFNRRSFARLGGFAPMELGIGFAYNLRQFCDLSYPVDYQNNPVSQLASVENKNKTVRPDSIFSERIGVVQYRLGPPPAQLDGLASLETGQQFVSHRVRDVLPIGFNQLNTGVGSVANKAADRTLPGVDSLSFGTIRLAQGPQGIFAFGVGVLEFGNQWVSDGDSRILPAGIDQSVTGFGWVSHSPRNIQTSGLSGAVGAQITVRFPPVFEAGTFGRDSQTFGLSVVRNRNFTINPIPMRTDEHGIPSVDNLRKRINLQGINSPYGSSHVVEFTTKTVRVPPLTGSFGSSDVRAEPILPFDQFADLFGVDSLDTEGDHLVTEYKVFPLGFDSSEIGDHLCREMALVLRSVVSDEIGDPEIVSYQTVTVDQGIGIDSWELDGAPRISPHTIWATTDRPAQANINHPPGRYDVVDAGVEKLGEPVVSNFLRTYSPASIHNPNSIGLAMVSQPSLNLVYPNSIRGRIGFLEAIGGDRTVNAGFNALESGNAVVSFLREAGNTITTEGLAGSIGTLWASRDPEELHPQGVDSLSFGESAWPQGLAWVSREYPPFVMSGIDATLFGTAWISRDPQEVVAGAGSQLSMLTTGINDRMRVRQRGRVTASAGDQSGVGLSWISPRNRTIMVGAPPRQSPAAPRVGFVVGHEGSDSFELGDCIADFTEAGKVKRAGVGEQLSVGSAVFSIRITATAGDVSAFGASIAYNSINPVGISALEFGGSVVAGSGGHVCGQLPRAIPAPASDFSSIGLAGVSNA